MTVKTARTEKHTDGMIGISVVNKDELEIVFFSTDEKKSGTLYKIRMTNQNALELGKKIVAQTNTTGT